MTVSPDIETRVLSTHPSSAGSSRPHVRDAIVLSGWGWKAFNVPERTALALGALGAKVLYCENPSSFARRQKRMVDEVETGIFRLSTRFFGHRLNRLPFLSALQGRYLAGQILAQARELQLKDPIVLYMFIHRLLPVCAQLKKGGLPIIHLCLDFPAREVYEHIRISDRTLVIPKAAFHRLKAQFGDKIYLIPQVGGFPIGADADSRPEPPDLARIPRPRLGYLGAPQNRLNRKVLVEVLSQNPHWHFVYFGNEKCFDLPNAHALAWRSEPELSDVVSNLDVGFMPYDCSADMNFYCVPLKLFDYFAAGLPVVATPILHLWEYKDMVYLGDTAEELTRAISRALSETIDSPERQHRTAVAAAHSIANFSKVLQTVLP